MQLGSVEELRMSFARVVALSMLAVIVGPVVVSAQTLGTFRWRTEPFCNVLNVTVTQNGPAFTLDGFDEQCDGHPRLPVHGIAVPQPNGTITLGLTVVHNPGSLFPVNLEAIISPATVSGTWRDSAGNSGSFAFNPTAAPGWPRPGATTPAQLPTYFTFKPNGAFAAIAGTQPDPLPASGPGKRLIWHAAKGAFRAGQVDGDQWNDNNIGAYSTAFGYNTHATGLYSLAAGVNSAATNGASVALGSEAIASGPAAIALGFRVTAGGYGSVVLGSRGVAEPAASGTFIFADTSTSSNFTGFAPNEFLVRAAGGTAFYSNASLTAGVSLAPNGGAWASVSDVNMKENFRDLLADDVLAKIARMPIREWNYKAQDAAIRHVGPTAQDFHAAFGLGEDPLRISTIDADGIALRAIQALVHEVTTLRERVAQLEAQQR
jgi:hypothetical protein